LVTIFSI